MGYRKENGTSCIIRDSIGFFSVKDNLRLSTEKQPAKMEPLVFSGLYRDYYHKQCRHSLLA